MIASEPNAKEKGVSPVAHLLVVRYAHKHIRNSSGHLPFLLVRDFLRQSRIVLLDASTWPLPVTLQLLALLLCSACLDTLPE